MNFITHFKNLNVFKVLEDNNRISSVDVFRAVAIISVVIYHFNGWLPHGNLGVDLFFVISGLLVGGLLTKGFKKNTKINFFKFFLQRGFKIWPSYYSFFLLGSILAFCFYHITNPEQIVAFWDYKRYLLFYQNYTGIPCHWSFDHVWSLCVEEHFYIILPVLYIFIQVIIPDQYKLRSLHIFIILMIVMGFVFKNISLYFTNGQDTYAATHNRIDALAWGVLLNLLVSYRSNYLKNIVIRNTALISGVIIFILTICIALGTDHFYFHKIILHTLTPISFFLMLAGVYYIDFSRFKMLRFVAYFSYNWYLWHPVYVIFITRHFGNTLTGFIIFILVSFLSAIIATVFIEEVVLSKRKKVINKLFKSEVRNQMTTG